MPLSLTVSITQKCNSRCKTCNIWQERRTPKKQDELSLEEYEQIFKSLGKSVIWYTLSGGEPFLRKDIVQIARLIKRYSDPAILTIPTNAILTSAIVSAVKEMLSFLSPGTTLIVNLSLDGIGDKHDEIRDIPGNFERFLKTYAALKELKKLYRDSFEIGVHSVVSKFNVELLPELFEYAKRELAPDSYICEIAENREELLNVDEDITPAIDVYERTIRFLQQGIRESLLKNRGIPGLIQSFRLKYYDYVVTEMREKRRVIPCYAGQVSAQISPWGDIWPCCILAYKAEMGNLRDFDLDFARFWYSDKARQIRKQVAKGDCYCPMANVHYTNMALTPIAMLNVVKNYIGARLKRPE
jgi:MoaA/NifB/PqqE/SkfB family radical SAM enzyme